MSPVGNQPTAGGDGQGFATDWTADNEARALYGTPPVVDHERSAIAMSRSGRWCCDRPPAVGAGLQTVAFCLFYRRNTTSVPKHRLSPGGGGGGGDYNLMRHPPSYLPKLAGGGGLAARPGGGLRATHYYHMHTSRGCVRLGGMGV